MRDTHKTEALAPKKEISTPRPIDKKSAAWKSMKAAFSLLQQGKMMAF